MPEVDQPNGRKTTVVFGTQSPPNKEEARKHYKRAVELGAEPDGNLEQLIK